MFKNPVETKNWKKILNHFNKIKKYKIIDFFKNDINRFKNFSINFKDCFLFDYSKNRINLDTMNLFFKLLNEINFKDYIISILNGEKIDLIKNKPILNFLFRDLNNFFSNKNSYLLNFKKDIDANLNKVKFFTNKIINYKWKGYSGENILNIVNIGSEEINLSFKMIIKTLYKYKINNKQKFYFISKINVNDIKEIIDILSPKNTLFIICSKNFSTINNLLNINIVKKWILNYYNNNKFSLNNHFILISNNFEKSIKFGVNLNNIFIVDNWIKEKYSFCSAFGLCISLYIGFENYIRLLKGLHDVDIHFFNSKYKKNIPIILAIISIWYNNFFNFQTEAIFTYSKKLSLFPFYLQQLIMESNGKYIDNNGNYIKKYNTSNIIWSNISSVNQYSFNQFLHQSKFIVPCDFISEIFTDGDISKSHFILISNFIAQTQFLAFGNKIFKKNKKKINKYKLFKGNRPSNSILIKYINPYTLGILISLYEYKILVQSIIWNICSFDKLSIKYGKKVSKLIYPYLGNNNFIDNIKVDKMLYLDNSTINLINYFNKNFKF